MNKEKHTPSYIDMDYDIDMDDVIPVKYVPIGRLFPRFTRRVFGPIKDKYREGGYFGRSLIIPEIETMPPSVHTCFNCNCYEYPLVHAKKKGVISPQHDAFLRNALVCLKCADLMMRHTDFSKIPQDCQSFWEFAQYLSFSGVTMLPADSYKADRILETAVRDEHGVYIVYVARSAWQETPRLKEIGRVGCAPYWHRLYISTRTTSEGYLRYLLNNRPHMVVRGGWSDDEFCFMDAKRTDGRSFDYIPVEDLAYIKLDIEEMLLKERKLPYSRFARVPPGVIRIIASMVYDCYMEW